MEIYYTTQKMNKTRQYLTIAFLLIQSISYSQTLDDRKTSIFPNDGPTATDLTNFSYTDSYVASNSFWASPFTEDHVYHARLKYTNANADQSYELRVGKGGQIYSFLTSAGLSTSKLGEASDHKFINQTWPVLEPMRSCVPPTVVPITDTSNLHFVEALSRQNSSFRCGSQEPAGRCLHSHNAPRDTRRQTSEDEVI